MPAAAILQSRYLFPALVVGLAVLGCSAILLFGTPSVGLVLALALVIVAFRFPDVIPYYLIAICVTQPLLLRWMTDGTEIWSAVKRLDEFSLALLLPVSLWRHLDQRRLPLPRITIVGLSIVLGIGLLASWLQSTAPFLIGLDAFLLLKGFMFFAIFSAFPVDEKGLRRLAGFGLTLAIGAALFGLAEMAFPELVRSLLPLDREGLRLGRVVMVSIFDNEGQAAWFFAFAATISFAFYHVYKRNGMLGVFLLFTLCAMLTLRRKPVGGLLVVLLATLLFSRASTNRIRTVLVVVGVIVGCGVMFGDTLFLVWQQGYDTYVGSREPTAVARTAMYITSFRLGVDYFPLGTGFGLFGGYASQLEYSPIYKQYGLSSIWGLSPQYNRFLLDAFWPHVLGQFGFFGLAAFVAAIAGIWRPLLHRFRNSQSKMTQALTLGAFLTFLESLAESAASPIFEATFSGCLLFGLAAIATTFRAEAT